MGLLVTTTSNKRPYLMYAILIAKMSCLHVITTDNMFISTTLFTGFSKSTHLIPGVRIIQQYHIMYFVNSFIDICVITQHIAAQTRFTVSLQ